MAVAFPAPHFPYGALNGYFGQAGTEDLRSYCNSGIDFITLGFVTKAPEHDPSGYPGTNFAGHCWATTYINEDGIESSLYDNCVDIQGNIAYCQAMGVKVLLSVGGVYNTVDNNYRLSNKLKGVEFGDFLYKAFGPYDPEWTGPRPFDTIDEKVGVDGFDFDIEAKMNNKPYVAMIETLRAHNSSLLITGAPQCPTSTEYMYMKEMIQTAQFDALFLQFYNNAVCDAIVGNTNPLDPGELFNYDQWETILKQSDKSKNAKIFIGLPSSPKAAGSGYVNPQRVKNLVCSNHAKKNWGGISLWDLHRGREHFVNGKNFQKNVVDALTYGCGAIPTKKKTQRREALLLARGNETTTASVSMTTSTVYATNIHTVTSCPPEVIDCPEGGYVTTEIVPAYTTICPVTPTETPSSTMEVSTWTTEAPSGTCAGTGCPGVPTPTETWSSKPPTVPTSPPQGAASGLKVGAMALFGAVAVQLLML